MDRLGKNLRRELNRLGPGEGLSDLAAAWPAAVGEAIARNAWPMRVNRDGTLVVHTTSAAWAFELGQLEGRLRESLGEHAPPRFRFVPGSLPELSADDVPDVRVPPPEPTAEHRAGAAAAAAEIEDDDLRKTVQRAAALSLAKAASDRPI